MVLRRLLMVLWVLVLLLLVMRHVVDAHIAVIAASLSVSHGSGGEVGWRHHDWSLHALLPYFAGAALFCLKNPKINLQLSSVVSLVFILNWVHVNDIPRATQEQWLWQHRHWFKPHFSLSIWPFILALGLFSNIIYRSQLCGNAYGLAISKNFTGM